jgi:hypothetical protein
MPALNLLMNAAILELQKSFLTDEQISSSRASWGSTRNLLMMEHTLLSSKMGFWPVAADGVGEQPSTEVTVHPAAMGRGVTRRRTLRGCAPCIRILASPAAAWVV